MGDAQLHPNGACANRDGLPDNSGDGLGLSENIDNINVPWDLGKRGVGLLPEHLINNGIYWNNLVSNSHQVLRHTVAIAVWLVGQANDGDSLAISQELRNFVGRRV